MNELERLIDQLANFATNYQITQIPTYYYDALFNYLGVSLYSSNQEAVQIVANTFKDDGGKYLPLGQQTPQTLANCVLIDCLSSAILAYDDIHLETTIHPCGPIASSLLAIARKQKSFPKTISNCINGCFRSRMSLGNCFIFKTK